MRILIFHGRLAYLTGGEVNTRDWALGLKSRGHKIVVFSVCPGPLAEQIRNSGIAVVEDPALVSDIPDIIFGAGVNDMATVLARFPEVPAIQVAQVWDHWNGYPSPLPQVMLHIAVDELNAEMLVNEFGLPRDRIRIVHNSVDMAQIPARKNPLPAQPACAAVLVKAQSNYVEAVSAACQKRNILVDFFGYPVGRPVECPAAVMAEYHLIIGTARTAIEGAAAGAAVLVADQRGLAGMLTTKNLSHFRANNFGRELLTRPIDEETISAELNKYDAHDASMVSKLIREDAPLERQLNQLEAIFAEAIDLFRQAPPSIETTHKALASYLASHLPRPAEGEGSPRHQRFHQAGSSLDERFSALSQKVATIETRIDAMDELVTRKND